MVSEKEQLEYWEEVKNRKSPYDPSVVAFAKPKVEIIRDNLELLENAKVLELGCGNGFFTVQLARYWDVTGIDRSRRMLDLNPHKNLIQGSVENLDFDDASFDIVFSANLLHHIPDAQSAVNEMARVAEKYLVLIEPNRNNPAMFLFSGLKKIERGALQFSESYLRSLLKKAGLKTRYSCTHGSITPNKTPRTLLPFLNALNKVIPLGLYIIAIGEKCPT